jgi:thiosulfate reductase cytochrome b subunit
LRIGDTKIGTDGVLGRSVTSEGEGEVRAFPRWITLPGPYDLAGARRYHLFAALIFAFGFLCYFLWAIGSRHAHRDISPDIAELKPSHLVREVADHARLRFPTGAAAARFNSLQKISYFAVLFILIPVMILTGLSMSPGIGGAAPWLIDAFGGRQSARSIHFIACWLLFAFFVIHILMVLLAGPWNEMRSMITGWFTLPPDRNAPQAGEGGSA